MLDTHIANVEDKKALSELMSQLYYDVKQYRALRFLLAICFSSFFQKQISLLPFLKQMEKIASEKIVPKRE